MLKDDNFKAILISILFSFAVLVILPKVPIFVSNQLFKIDSRIGGYEVNLLGLNLDLRGFKGGIDVQGGKKVVLKVEASDQRNTQNSLASLIEITKKRLLIAGYSDYEIGVESLDEGKIYVSVSKFVDFDKVSTLVSGNGVIEIKKLADSVKWDTNKASEIILKPENWVSAGLSNNEIIDLKLLKDQQGQDQMQIILSSEGRSKFKEFLLSSLDKPFAIHINRSQLPIAVPLVSQSLLDNPNSDPIITGRLPLDVLKVFLIQMKDPFTSKVTVTIEGDITAKLGNDFLTKYLLAFVCGVIISFCFLTLKFKKFGLIGGASLFLSIIIFLATFKIFSLVINIPSIVAFTLLTLILFDITNIVLSKIISNSKDSSDKPINLSIYQGFKGSVESFRLVAVTFFLSMFILSYFILNDIKFFISTLLIGVLIIIFHYFYSLKTFIGLFGEKK